MRARTRWLVAVASGALVAATAAVVPVPPVHGSVSTGPLPPRARAVDHRLSARWAAGHRGIDVVVRHAPGCAVRLRWAHTFAPARLQVRLAIPPARACPSGRLRTVILLPVPAATQVGQSVVLIVDGARLAVPQWTPHGTPQNAWGRP